MSLHGNGQQKTFRVVQSGAVKQVLVEQYERAKFNGEGVAFIAALEHVYNRLRTDPHNFGEPKYRLHAMKAIVCLAVHPPLTVEFGIHETMPLVMIRRVTYLKKLQ